MSCQPQRRSSHAFTVAEVLMVLLLLSAVLGLIIVNFLVSDGALDKRPALDQIRLAVADAHRLARTQRTTILLTYDKETEQVYLRDPSGSTIKTFPFAQGTGAQLKFFRILPETQFQEEPDFKLEDDAIDFIRFESYGSSAPFIIEFETADSATELRFDPFSSTNWRESDAI